MAHELLELSELSQREILNNKLGHPRQSMCFLKCVAFEEELNQLLNYPAPLTYALIYLCMKSPALTIFMLRM